MRAGLDTHVCTDEVVLLDVEPGHRSDERPALEHEERALITGGFADDADLHPAARSGEGTGALRPATQSSPSALHSSPGAMTSFQRSNSG